MASIRLRPTANGNERWLVQVRRKDEPSVAKTFPTRRDAEIFADLAEKNVASVPAPAAIPVAPVKPRRSSPRQAVERLENQGIGEIVRAFVARPRENMRHGAHAPKVILHVGDAIVDDITNDWILGYIDKLRSSKTKNGVFFSHATIKKHMTLMKLAIEWRANNLRVFCPEFPFKINNDFPRDWENKRTRRLTRDEQLRLLRQLRGRQGRARHHWRLLVKLALQTGARLQELLKAEWTEFDANGLGWIIPKEHTKAFKERKVPFTNAARRTIKALRRLADPSTPRVFHTLMHIEKNSVSGAFHAMVKAAKIENFRFHDLRHEAVTQIILRNPHVSPTVLMKITGHGSFDVFDGYFNAGLDELPQLN